MRVAVLGCGPAGLLAAHAAHVKGASISIFSKPEPSHIHGAQFLHRPIPLLTRVRPDARVVLYKYGTAAGYARKVYGSASAPTSWDSYPAGRMEIWSMQDAYERLWDWYGPRVEDVDLSEPEALRQIIWDQKFDLVVSSVPAKVLCKDESHKFEDQPVWIVRAVGAEVGNGRIIYDGSDVTRWYRASMIFNHPSTEYPMPPGSNAVKVSKPLRTDCDCWTNNLRFIRVGRYGAWEKRQLAHWAFENVMDCLA